MFWDTGYSNSANIDALLNKESCTLRDLLDDEDILQECKSQNQKLVKFLNRNEIVDELITLISTEPSTEYAEEKRFLYPNVACEIITSDVPSLKQRLVEDPLIMNKLFSFFEQAPPLNPLLASFICKTFSTLIIKKMETDWFLYQTICLHVLEFIKSKDNFLDAMTQHFATPVVVDLMLNMLNDVEDDKMKSSFLEWVNEKGLIGKMIDVLQSPNESSKHGSIAQFLTEVIKIARCSRQNDTEDKKGLPNPLLQTLEDGKTVDHLLDVILCEPRSESGILSGIQVLLCLLENPIIQEPVSQSALQQMIDAEKEHHDEIVTSLMVIIQPRVHQLFELLMNPPIRTPVGGSPEYPLTAPLGSVRLQMCYLFTVLLETENTPVIEEICKSSFFVELLKLFKQYCWNNFLHTYVKKCLVYGVQAFDTIPNSTQLVISALQKHIVVNCKVTDKLMDCWNENQRSQLSGGRRLGYMGHLIDILSAVQSSMSVSDEIRALIESSLSINTGGEGEPVDEGSSLENWRQILQSNEDELKMQNRLLADCDPNERQDYGRDVSAGFPSNTAEYENDTEDFDYQYNSSMHDAVNGLDFPDDFTNDDDLESRNRMFEDACSQNLSNFTMDTNFADWNNADATANHDFPFNFNSALDLKSASPFDNDSEEAEKSDDDPFANAANGLDSMIGNNNISNHHLYHQNGAYDQNNFLMNFYVSPITITNTNYPLSATNHPSSYNPFKYHHEAHGDGDVNSNNDNWANFNTDNFADFDSHFVNMGKDVFAMESKEGDNSGDQVEHATETCFVATTQTVEISKVPPEPVKSGFVLGPVGPIDFRQVLEELEEDEFFSLRDDSNDMSSLTDDIDKRMLENTEVPDDEDDDFASADESSSKGNSEEETNSNGGDQFVDCTISPPPDAKNYDHSYNGVDDDVEASLNDDIADRKNVNPAPEPSKMTGKAAQAPESELISPVVPLENGSA